MTINRRNFLKSILLSTGVISTPSTFANSLALAESELNDNNFADRKSIVSIFLTGGNDSFNLVIPNGEEYKDYASTRQGVDIDQSELLPLHQNDCYSIGVHSKAPEFQELFNNKRMSIIANIGPLTEPPQLGSRIIVPDNLSAHNSQQALWQMGHAIKNTDELRGWAGRMADMLQDTNAYFPMNISVSGLNQFHSGWTTRPYVLSTETIGNSFYGINDSEEKSVLRKKYFEKLAYTQTKLKESIPFQATYAQLQTDAIELGKKMMLAMDNTSTNTASYPTTGPGANLSKQLKRIADAIEVASYLKLNRQTFFAEVGGFDNHNNQNIRLPSLQGNVFKIIKAFDDDLISRNLSNSVTTLVQSEFGRTLIASGDGTDHGWGGHAFVIGGSINGGRVFGDMPIPSVKSEYIYDKKRGRTVPTTSVEQVGSLITEWFGLNDTQRHNIFPNLNKFESRPFELFQKA